MNQAKHLKDFWIVRGKDNWGAQYFLTEGPTEVDDEGYVMFYTYAFCRLLFEATTGIKLKPGEKIKLRLTEVGKVTRRRKVRK